MNNAPQQITARRSSANKRNLKQAMLSAAAMTVLFTHSGSAAESTWVGTAPIFGGTTLWSAAGNWSGNAIPASGNDVRFGTGFTSGTSINAAGDRIVGNLTISAISGFTLANFGGTGNTISVNSGNINRTAASTGTQTISSNLNLGQNANWNIQGSGGLILAGSLYTPGFTSVEKSGSGTLSLSTGTFDFNGGLAVSEGSLFLNDSSYAVARAGANSTSLRVVNNGQLSVLGGSELASTELIRINDGGSALVSGAGSKWINSRASAAPSDPVDIILVGENSTATLTVNNGGSLTTRNALSIGDNTGANGTLAIQTGGKVESQYGLLGVDGAGQGTATLSGAGSSWKINDDLLLGTDTVGRGEITVGRDASVSVTLRTEFTGQTSEIYIKSGTLSTGGLNSATNCGRIVMSKETAGAPLPTLNLGNGTYSTGNYTGTLTGEGNLSKTGAGTQTLAGTVSLQGTTTINGGELIIPNGFGNSSTGTILVNSGGTLTIGKNALGNVSGLGAINASATLTIGNQTLSDAVNFGGIIDTQGNHVSLLSSNQSTVSGTVNLGQGALLDSNNKLINNGVIKVRDNSSATISGAIQNNGTISGATAGFGTLTLTGPVGGGGGYDGQITMTNSFDPSDNGYGTISLNTLFLKNTSTIKVDVYADNTNKYSDSIRTSRWVDMAGTLDIRSTGNSFFRQGDSFNLISFIFSNGTLSGTFSNILGREINTTTWLAVMYGQTNVWLAVALPGDATLDGRVNLDDFTLLAAKFGMTGNWLNGNFDGDATIDLDDFTALAANFGRSLAADLPRGSNVPEPTTTGVAAVLTTSFVPPRRRRTK